MKKLLPMLLIGTLSFSSPSYAFIDAIVSATKSVKEIAFQTKNIALNLAQKLKLFAILKNLKESLEIAKEATGLARSTVSAVNLTTYFAKRPKAMLGFARKQFERAFPDYVDIMADIYMIENDIERIREGDEYDPYAFQEMMFRARNLENRYYEMAMHLSDEGKVSDPHNALKNDLIEEKKKVDGLIDDVEALFWGGEMTPQDAMFLSARLAARQARAQLLAANSLNEMLRIQKVQYSNSVSSHINSQAVLSNERKSLKALRLKSFQLNPSAGKYRKRGRL